MTPSRLSTKELDEVYASLCANGLNPAVAGFLTDLVGRVNKLECAGGVALVEACEGGRDETD